MTTYKELFGKYVQNVTTDPTSTDAEGQIWYNSTTGAFRTALGGVGAWSSGGNLNTARAGIGGAGIQTATVAFGGVNSPTFYSATELYNGTSWTTNPNSMATARRQMGSAGIQTAALAFGGTTTVPLVPFVGNPLTGVAAKKPPICFSPSAKSLSVK
jgi:hypothetical protein